MQAIAWLEIPLVIGNSVTEVVIGVLSSLDDGNRAAFSISDGTATLVSAVDHIITLDNADAMLWMVQDQDGNLLPGVIDTRTPA